MPKNMNNEKTHQADSGKYSVVSFPGRDEVAVVPSIWLNKDKTLCYWPSDKLVSKFVQRYEEPDFKNWKIYEARVLGTYATLLDANQKLKRAEDTSDINTSDERGRGRRKRKRSPSSSSSSSSSEDESPTRVDIHAPSSSKLFGKESKSVAKKPTKKLGSRISTVNSRSKSPSESREQIPLNIQRTSTASSKSHVSLSKSKLPREINTPIRPRCSGLANPFDSASTSQTGPHPSFLPSQPPMPMSSSRPMPISSSRPMPISSSRPMPLSSSRPQVQVTQADLASIFRSLDKILAILRTQGTEIETLANSRAGPREIQSEYNGPPLPLSSIQDFDTLETAIDDDGSGVKAWLEQKIISTGGRDAGGCARHVMRKLMNNSVARMFSWAGRRGSGKRAFKNTALCSVIIDTLVEKFSETEFSLGKILGEHLKHIPNPHREQGDRDGNVSDDDGPSGSDNEN